MVLYILIRFGQVILNLPNKTPTGYQWGQRQEKNVDPHASGFLQFLDCVWQLWNQFPIAFEFSEEFLLFVIDSVYNSRFGTFLFDTPKQRATEKAQEKTISLWTYTQFHKEMFANPYYQAPGKDDSASILKPCLDHVTLWNAYFLRWVCNKALR